MTVPTAKLLTSGAAVAGLLPTATSPAEFTDGPLPGWTWEVAFAAEEGCYETDTNTDPCETGDGIYRWYSTANSNQSTAYMRQSGSSNRPTWRNTLSLANNEPCVEFFDTLFSEDDISTTFSGSLPSTISKPYTVIWVGYVFAATSDCWLWCEQDSGTTSGPGLDYVSADIDLDGAYSSSTTRVTVDATFNEDSRQMVIYEATSSGSEWWVNNVSAATNGSTPDDLTAFSMGIDGGDFDSMGAWIYGNTLTAQQRTWFFDSAENVWGTFDL